MTLGKAILEALDAAREARPQTATAILGLIKNDLPKVPQLKDVEKELKTLKERGEVLSFDETDRGLVHSITDKGRARALS